MNPFSFVKTVNLHYFVTNLVTSCTILMAYQRFKNNIKK